MSRHHCVICVAGIIHSSFFHGRVLRCVSGNDQHEENPQICMSHLTLLWLLWNIESKLPQYLLCCVKKWHIPVEAGVSTLYQTGPPIVVAVAGYCCVTCNRFVMPNNDCYTTFKSVLFAFLSLAISDDFSPHMRCGHWLSLFPSRSL